MNLYAIALTLSRQAILKHRITDSYSIHRLVYSLFADIRSEAEKHACIPSGIQYQEMPGDEMSRRIIILSNRMPISGTPPEGIALSIKLIDKSFLHHQKYTFKTTVVPIRRDNKTRELTPIKDSAEIAQWFTEKANRHLGFEVIAHSLDVLKVEVDVFSGKEGRVITLGKAHLQGHLQVTDRDLFIQAFSRGVGRGRAFGCGLLQLVPVLDSFF